VLLLFVIEAPAPRGVAQNAYRWLAALLVMPAVSVISVFVIVALVAQLVANVSDGLAIFIVLLAVPIAGLVSAKLTRLVVGDEPDAPGPGSLRFISACVAVGGAIALLAWFASVLANYN
jgi:hypothetical protein